MTIREYRKNEYLRELDESIKRESYGKMGWGECEEDMHHKRQLYPVRVMTPEEYAAAT